jgi:hypothetical protein
MIDKWEACAMTTSDIKCPECNGSGTVLKHFYNQDYANRFGNAGSGLGYCPRCNGSGTVSGYESDVSGEDYASDVFIFVLAWLVLFYLTYQIYVPLFEMIFGNDVLVPEDIKWLNLFVMMIPPTVIVYIFRKFIPILVGVGILAGVIALTYTIISN